MKDKQKNKHKSVKKCLKYAFYMKQQGYLFFDTSNNSRELLDVIRYSKTFYCTLTVGCQKFSQYIHTLRPGQFFFIAAPRKVYNFCTFF